ncbi:AbrB/MazE/SpoVT family DNA-binding domain-containing protein [Candidatus Woesearchaeota archaeon]|nr:AbrB/MazE/SpoVT family DNA-binding domain-containing protein [Candidatus Woesearchaeota archaeon]
MENKACEECGGKVIRKKLEYIYLGENLGKFDADVCTKCNEQVFDEETFQRIEALAKNKGLWGLAAKSKVSQIGNSVAVTINKKIAGFVNLKKGEEVRVYPESKNRIIIETS